MVGDFGLASRMPRGPDERLPQVGSPYWMSPECLRGCHYGPPSDVFSFGLVALESVGRVDADPDCLPRTGNFGVDYVAFARDVAPADAPADLLRAAFACVRVDPALRPDFGQCADQLEAVLSLVVGDGQIDSAGDDVRGVGEEMSRLDPDYVPSPPPAVVASPPPVVTPVNPFVFPRTSKMTGSMLFCSCFEVAMQEEEEEEEEEEAAVTRRKAPPPIRKAVSLVNR